VPHPDAHEYLQSLVGQTITTLRGRPNIVLAVNDDDVYVGTGRSPGGQAVSIADIQSTIDRVWGGEEVPISPEAVGFRSAFVGAVLGSMVDVEVLDSPLRVRLAREQPTRNPSWEYDELILALDLYLRRGQPPVSDTEVIALSQLLNRLPIHESRPDSKRFRNPNAVHMKLANFKGPDPSYMGSGLRAGGIGVSEVWQRFANDPDALAAAVTQIMAFADGDEPFVPEEDESEAVEGRVLFRAHRVRERNPALVKKKKAAVLRRGHRLLCEVCDLDFAEAYGPLGEGFIECHHTIPLALGVVRKTKIEDLALVCSNCHRVLHRAKEPISVGRLRMIVEHRRVGRRG
jgi:5-methylcytosine-specific restriction enzyme A